MWLERYTLRAGHPPPTPPVKGGEFSAIFPQSVISVKKVDLHTSTFNQALAAEYLAGNCLAHHLPRIIALYQPKQEAMLNALDRYFPADFNWSRPEGAHVPVGSRAPGTGHGKTLFQIN